MAKFIFKMESILSIKYKLEDQAKAEYGMEVAKLREEVRKRHYISICIFLHPAVRNSQPTHVPNRRLMLRRQKAAVNKHNAVELPQLEMRKMTRSRQNTEDTQR